jgi:hypothetical protein
MPTYTMDVKQAVAAGDSLLVNHLMPEKSIQFSGFNGVSPASLATAKVMGSNDKTNWDQIGSDVTADGIMSVTTPIAYLRIDISSYDSGVQGAVLCGYGAKYEP